MTTAPRTSTATGTHDLTARLWQDLGGGQEALEHLRFTGPDVVLPSIFDVTGFAAATVAAASLAVAELAATRRGGDVADVVVDRRGSAAAFRCEALLTPDGWELPPIWDPIAGDYRTADGWIRLHTNYLSHRDAALSVLDVPVDRDAVSAAVSAWRGDDLESAVVAAGGCAAVQRTAEEWAVHPASGGAGADGAGRAMWVMDAPGRAEPLGQPPLTAAGPLAGVRVLDLTRVIAGPVGTRFLAAYGADVLRIDPPGFEEVGALLPETTLGKRCAALDLRDASDRSLFERLVAEADVLVGGFRSDAMARLGYGPDALRSINPGLIVARHDAYGWDGPWSTRRGFDSLVQMSVGITAAGALAAGTDRPTPLPAQALDHGTGYLHAAAVCRALTRRHRDGVVSDTLGSLAGAAGVLTSLPTADAFSAPAPTWTDHDTVADTSPWGPLRRAPVPGRISGIEPSFGVEAGPLGRDEPRWTD